MFSKLTLRCNGYSRHIIHRSFSSTSNASILTQKDVDFFRTEGYLAVQNFFDDDEFRAIRAGLIKLKYMGRLANVATDGDGVTHTVKPKNLQLCPLSPELPIFQSLPFHNKVSNAISKLLVDDEYDSSDQDICCYLSQTFWKPPNHGLGTGMHQDNAYFMIEKPHFGAALWIPTHRATKENGTIQVVKGFAKATDYEHGSSIEHRRDSVSDHHITCRDVIYCEYKDDIVHLELDEGGVAFFNFNVPHCTGPNPTDEPRAAVAYHFLNMHHYKERQFPLPEDAQYIAPIICGPHCSDGIHEYGDNVGHHKWIKDMNDMLLQENDIMEKELQAEKFGVREVRQDRITYGV